MNEQQQIDVAQQQDEDMRELSLDEIEEVFAGGGREPGLSPD